MVDHLVVCAACGGSYAKGAYSSKQLRQNRARHRQRCRACVQAGGVVDAKHQDTVRAVAAGTARAPPPAALLSPPSALLSALLSALRDWEPGLVEIIEAVLDAQTPVMLTHLRAVTLTLTHLRAGAGFDVAGFDVAEDGRLVTDVRRKRHTDPSVRWSAGIGHCSSAHWLGTDSTIVAPALRNGACVGITLRRGETCRRRCSETCRFSDWFGARPSSRNIVACPRNTRIRSSPCLRGTGRRNRGAT